MSWEEIKNKYKKTNTYFKSQEEINNSIDGGKESWNRIKNKYINSTNNTSSKTRKNGEEFINRLKTQGRSLPMQQKAIPTYMKKESLWDTIKKITNNERNFKSTYNKNNNMIYTPFLEKNQENKDEELQFKLLSNQKTQTNEEFLERLSSMNNAQRVKEIRAITKNEKDFNKLNLEAIQYKQSKEASQKAEKINQDIDNGNYGSAIGHVLSGIPTKALDSVTTTVSSMPSILPSKKINSFQPDEDELLKANKILSKNYEETTSNINNNIVKTASSVSGTIGAMTPSILSNLMIPGSGKIVQAINTGTDAYQETLNDNTDNKVQSLLTGIAKGGASYAIEGITGGNFLGKGSLDDIAKKTISNNLSSPISKRIASKLYEIGGEIFEEEIENQAGYVIDKIINDKNISGQEWWNDATETAKNTLLTTVVLNLMGLGGETYREIVKNENDTKTKQIIKEAENIIKNENLKVDTNNTQSQENVGNNINIENQQDVVFKEQNYYRYKQTDNQKINNLRKDMSKYWDNSQKTIDLGNTIEKIISDKNYNIRLDDSITNKKGQLVNAQIKTLENGEVEIRINPNSKNVGEFLIMHETTHAIGTQEMKDLVMDYASKNSEFSNALESLKKTYGVEDVSDEVLSDISAQLFGNQEFINNLSMQKPNIFKRIYNKIVELANKITGNSNEALFIKDLKNKWEEAYRTQNNNLDGNTHFSVVYNNDGSFNRVKITDNIFENNNNKSITKTIKDYLTQHIGEYAEIIESGQKVYLGEDLPGEYTFSKSTRGLTLAQKMAKGRATTGLKEIINNATNRKYSNYKKTKHITDAKYGFYKYDTKFSFELNGKEQTYSGTILIRNDANGKKYLYDILDIKKIGSNLPPVASNSYKSSANIGGSNSLPTNSIPSTKDNVNSTTKYSMQKSENNSLPTKEWSEHLKNNYKATGTRTNLEDIKLPTRKYINEMTLTDYLDARGLDYEIDEDGNLISVKDKQAVKDYFIKKHKQEAIQKNQEIDIEDNYKTDLEAFKGETDKLNLPTNKKIDNTINTELLTDEDYKVLNDIYEKEGRTEILTEKRKANILEKYMNDKYTFRDSLDILAQKIVNKGHYVDKLSEQAKNPELKFLYDRNLNSFAEGQYVIGIAQTDNNGNQIGKSINDIWKPVEETKLTKEFSEYLLHKLNIDRGERNKFVFGKEIKPADSTKIALELENKYPEFKRYAQDIKNFNHNNLLNLKEAGLITQETIDYLEKLYPYYVPISRDKDGKIFVGDNERTGTNLPIKKATGGSSDIQPIKDTMAQQAIRIKRLINQNKLGQELAKTLKNSKVEQQADIQYTPDALMEYETLVEADNKGNKYYTYFEDGYMQKLKISDELYESLKPTKISELEKTLPVKALQKITNIHRSLLTSSNPVFIVSNFFKDVQDGMFNSKYSSKFIKNYGKALHEIITKGKYYESYMANGGMTNTYFDYNEGIKKKRNKFVEKIRSTNEIVEQLPRLSEFISTLEDGKSLNEALYNAAEITTNFKRGGEITKAINRNGVNFLNASIQGLDKQFRNFSGQNGAKGYANLLLKATILGVAPSVLNHILLEDDDDYEDLPENTKDLYYLFKYNDGKFIRIPKGRVLSIFGSSARRVLETVQGKEDSFDGFTDTLINQMAPNNPLEDNILAPIIQVKNNRTWYGGEIVSSSTEKNVLPKNQYDETTDEFSKWIGKQLNVSPKKVNYLIDQYSGGVGDVILPMITPQAKQNVFKDKFTTDSVMKNKNVGKFYETLEKQTQISDDSFATDEDKLQSQYLNEISDDMSDLYKEKREIQMSDISNSEKTEKVREIQEEINKLAEKGLSEYSNGTYKKNSAKIGDIEYYKDGKGEWTKLTEEEISKNKNISTETYATYKQKIYKETQNKRKSGELTENQNLKSADRIQILLDSKYSEKEIGAIYENYIKSESDIEYNIMKTAGIDTKEYLKYKQQEFTSDKKDDGTLEGKTVSKSKQKKVVEYLNTMNITGNQRLLLYAMQGYTTTSSQKNQLANYVQGLKLDKDTKLKLYDKFSGFKVYKNGRVTW